jgi:hypothetical protein
VRLTRDEQEFVAQVSVENLEAFTLAVSRTVRLSGSPEERKAFRTIAARLRHWGYEVVEHRPLCWTSWPGAALLEILGPTPESIPCITHAMAASTPPEGLTLELADAGAATPAELAGAAVAGRAVLADGLAMSSKAFRIEQAGAAAEIHICGDHLHEMITSTVWGSPSQDDVARLPRIPMVSVARQGGARLRRALDQGPVRVRIRAQVDTGWRPLPVLIAHLAAPRGRGDFLLFSGHVDSWHYGAMDNGSANATQLEVARIMAGRRGRLRRDLRLAFWSGHSHGRYAGSAWYADAFWQELHDGCVAHVNVDSVGAKGATLLSEAIAMAEVRGMASEAVEKVSGQRLSGVRPQRAGDQSFWGHGIPSLFMTLSEQPAGESETARAFSALMGRRAVSGGLGWWWHTTQDTPDKLDPDHMLRDCRIYALAIRRLLEDPILPLDYRAWTAEARQILEDYRKAAKGRFDLAPVFAELEELDRGLKALHRRLRAGGLPADAAGLANGCLMSLGRELIPIAYCRAERFTHDAALPVPPFPGLEPMRRLGGVPPASDEARRLTVGLVRARNKVCYHLGCAAIAVQAALAALPAPPRKARKG